MNVGIRAGIHELRFPSMPVNRYRLPGRRGWAHTKQPVTRPAQTM
jgi:hypothetical protein